MEIELLDGSRSLMRRAPEFIFRVNGGVSRMALPMKALNSLGEISPSPLKRVISAPRPQLLHGAASRSVSL
jgi:hypothetical protein